MTFFDLIRVNHAAVTVGQTVYSFGGYCTDENYAELRPIDIHILNPGKSFSSFIFWVFLSFRPVYLTTFLNPRRPHHV